MYIQPTRKRVLIKQIIKKNKDVASGVIKAPDAPTGSLKDRIFLLGTGTRLVTPGEIAKIIKQLAPDADIEVGAGLTEWNKKKIKYRGLINIGRAREQLGYDPRYDIRMGIEAFTENSSQNEAKPGLSSEDGKDLIEIN